MSKKQSEKQKESTQTTSATTPAKKLGNRRLIVTVLSVLFVIGGVLILRLHRPAPVAPKPTVSVTMKRPAPVQIPAQIVTEPTPVIETPVVEPAPAAENTIEPAPFLDPIVQTMPEPEEIIPEIPAEPVTEPVEQPLPQALQEHAKLAAGTAKLGDILALRDNFTNNDSCTDGYEKLLTLEPRTPLLQNAMDALAPICTKKEPVMSALTHTFSKAKKRAVMAYYKAKYPRWWFIKAIPVSVIEIRRLNPRNYRPMDKMHRAHNALIRQDIDQAIRFVNELPPLMRAQMDDFVAAAQAYNNARAGLDAVILSFEKGE